MKIKTRYLLLACPLLAATHVASAATFVVDKDGFATTTNCNAANPTPLTSISAALAIVANGDKIIVCPANYNEQVVVNKKVTITGVLGATVKPSPMVVNSSNVNNGLPYAVGIMIGPSGSGTVIDQLTVDLGGYGLESMGCGVSTVGVYFRSASGTVSNSVAKNVRLGSGLEGCQSGLGILAQSTGPATTVNVNGNHVHDYQKNGITANTAGVTLNASKNFVSGDGSTPFIAQNGIQISFGAKGKISNNQIADLVYTPCSVISDAACQNGSSSGIIIFDAAPGLQIIENIVANTQNGIYFQAANGVISSNKVQNISVYDGIELVGDGNTAKTNSVFGADESSVYINGSNNTVTGNLFNEAAIGVLIDSGSGNSVPLPGASSANSFYNIPELVRLPLSVPASAFAARAAGKAQGNRVRTPMTPSLVN